MDSNVGAPGAGPAGEFRTGNPYSTPRGASTAVTARFLDSFRQEVNALLAAAGLSPSATDNTQLLTAMQLLYARGLPPGQRGAVFSQGVGADPERFGALEQVAHYDGTWGAGDLPTSGSIPTPYYEEATGEYYNAPGPQTTKGGFGMRQADARTADFGVWLPKRKFIPGDVLWINLFGRIKQADAGAARNFYLCFDPNGDANSKQNAWGSNDAVVLIDSVPANQFPNRIPFWWTTAIVYVTAADQLYLSWLSVPNKTLVSGKRYSSGAPYQKSWGIDLQGGAGYDFRNPPVATGKKNWRGNTLLGTRWAVSGTQDGTAQICVYTLDAYLSHNRLS